MSRALGKIVAIFGLVGLITFSWYRWSGDQDPQGMVHAASGEKLMVINVLDRNQYDDCHIKKSVNVEFDQLSSLAQKLDKETELVFYCSNYMCAGSGKAAKLFKQQGFTKVWAYEAGMAEWYKLGLPVEGNCKAAYLQMKNDPLEPQEDSEFDIITTDELKTKLGF